jgi:deazaflavin-dependent oxidoreductase (nitroreductase family)
MTDERNAWNQQITDEFRANGGIVGGMFEGMTLLLLHHTGAKSGTAYISPLATIPRPEGAWTIVASNGGRDKHPSWYFNLQARPDTTIEFSDGTGGIATPQVKARIVEGTERDELFAAVKAAMPQFAAYENGTARRIPLVVLEPTDG